ncbi:tRNA uridine-5-carboxymethylaminomethyl(34) synthesis GTPase MnmE, partial [Pasteurella multocida]|nr:tRNA uridine-5-carboxymethylaminomethyl(34) synthesis GTPase MnmE [Pasteurella multocida]
MEEIEEEATHLQKGEVQLKQMDEGEILEEEVRRVQNEISESTGQFTSDDLLGNIGSYI